jgi:regulation of enolase protein 1 (concanavalin A-like superfamily)
MTTLPTLPGVPTLCWLNDVVGDAVSSSDDVLTMVTGKETDWFNPPPDPSSPSRLANAPALVFSAPQGVDWQLSAKVTVKHQYLFDAGTLFVHQGDNDWCKLCFEYSPEKLPTVVSVVTRDISDDANGAAIPAQQEEGASPSVHLRISKYGPAGVMAFHYSIDGGNYWTLHRAFSLRNPHASTSIGFLAQAPTGESCTASFSQIEWSETTLSNLRDGS